MVRARQCAHVMTSGRLCQAPSIGKGRFCFWHSPDSAAEAAEASRLGGLRRRREKTVAGAYDIAGLDSVAGIRRVLEIAMLDALGLENSIARARVLITAAGTATKLLEAAALASYSGLEDEA